MHEPRDILVVDDDPAIRALLVEILRDGGHRPSEAMSATSALARLCESSVDLVVSDIDMPGMDGLDLLRAIKSSRPDVEVIMLTALSDLETAMRSMRLGATDYLTKPFNFEQVRMTVARALDHRRLVLENRTYREGLEKRVAERTAALERKTGEAEELYRRLDRSYQTTLEALATALDTRDAETLGHSVRVASFAVAVAERMGVGEPALTDIYRGALLHDVGKIGIPDAILRKPGKLTAAEWHEMRKHPEIGARMLEGIRFLSGALPIVLYHQAR